MNHPSGKAFSHHSSSAQPKGSLVQNQQADIILKNMKTKQLGMPLLDKDIIAGGNKLKDRIKGNGAESGKSTKIVSRDMKKNGLVSLASEHGHKNAVGSSNYRGGIQSDHIFNKTSIGIPNLPSTSPNSILVQQTKSKVSKKDKKNQGKKNTLK
mmetsp:Transcript_39017/g.59392  ORF Transcript_39017/g.59392 Transcript_39017/m.59392 type:complete len:154 (-) Transcript_39017:761-1222(-)